MEQGYTTSISAQTTDYYPFGKSFENVNVAKNRYLYNGKELQDQMVGGTPFGWYDYGARFYDPEVPHFTSLDPLAEKHYDESTYIYCGSNPINRIDPDGQDWYRSTDGNAVTWRKGSEEIEGYKNIGTTYTQSIGNGVSVTYNQNEASSMTFVGAEKSSWESQIVNGTNCYQASVEMLKNEGVETAGRGSEILMTKNDGNGSAGNATSKSKEGVKQVDKALENGNPIIVGVDYHKGSPNKDGVTDHFVVVSSKTEKLKDGKVVGKTYNFLDPGTSYKSKGTSSTNVLNVNSQGRLVGGYYNFSKTYVVSTVRRNKR